MSSQADQFAAELIGSGTLVDKEYARLLAATGQPASKYSLRDLYELAGETPRLAIGRYSSVGPPPPTYDSIILADSPIAYWRLADLTGTDESGSGYNATVVNSPVLSPGPTGTGIQFNGSNQYATLSLVPLFNSALQSDAWTIEMLISVPSGHTAGGAIIGEVDSGTAELVLLVVNSGTTSDFSTGSGYTGIHIRTAAGGSPVRWTTIAQALPYDGQWHHLVITGPRTPVTFYVDGLPVSMTTTPSQVPSHNGFDFPPALSANNSRGTISNFSPLKIAEVALYASNLSAATIANHAAAAGF